MMHVEPCDGGCFGLMCACGYSACIRGSFDHPCVIGQTNALWSVFLALVMVALVVGLRT